MAHVYYGAREVGATVVASCPDPLKRTVVARLTWLGSGLGFGFGLG